TSAWAKGNPPNTARRVRAATIIVGFIVVPPARRRAAAGVPADPCRRPTASGPSKAIRRSGAPPPAAKRRTTYRHRAPTRRHVGHALDAGLAHTRLPGQGGATEWPLVARTLLESSGSDPATRGLGPHGPSPHGARSRPAATRAPRAARVPYGGRG